jgi:hypothetical protein
MAAQTTPTIDTRRRTAEHAGWSRIKVSIERALLANIRSYVRTLRANESDAANNFISNHIRILGDGYKRAHWLGIKEYWGDVSLKSNWVRQQDLTYPNLARHMSFYAPSVAKMAREIADIVHQQQMQLADDPFIPFQPRVGLQADLTWTAFQDGYGNAITYDDAKPYLYLYWELDPSARKHCPQCPMFAAGSPYVAPGQPGNQLHATPGDGHTDCGAGCKCDLHYDNSSDDNTSADWARVWGNAPAGQFAGLTTNVPSVPHGVLSYNQKAALDYYRKATQLWSRAPYAPDLGTMFAPRVQEIEWWRLTDEQRRALQMISDAIEAWTDEESAELSEPHAPQNVTVPRSAIQSVIANKRVIGELLSSVVSEFTLRAVVHDAGKFMPDTFVPQRERHHPDHFADGVAGVNGIDLIEACCDWIADADEDGEDIDAVLGEKRQEFNIDDQTFAIISHTVDWLLKARSS